MSQKVRLKINGLEYFSAPDVVRELGVSRQTLWRWRQQGKIPLGHRFRDGRVLFTASEVEAIRQFANHVKPIDRIATNQLNLFSD